MSNQIVKYTYEEQEVEFDLADKKIMVNATEMAKIFGKKVEAFMRNEGTQAFVTACLKSENSRFLGVKSETDLYVSRQRSGSWMHRILALKFAAWLDPHFEVWVYYTIDQIIQGVGPLQPQLVEELMEVQTKLNIENERIRKAKERIQARNAEDQRIIDESTVNATKYLKQISKIKTSAGNQLQLFAINQKLEEDELNKTQQQDQSDSDQEDAQ